MSARNKSSAALLTAAFIGPGTVTVCTLAGASTGYELLWALVFSLIATFLLQEMVARVTLASHESIEKNIASINSSAWSRKLLPILIIAVIIIGNTAFEAGNILGGHLGLSLIIKSAGLQFGNISTICAISVMAGLALWMSNIDFLKNTLIGLVILMSLAFITAALASKPDWYEIINGLLVPNIPYGKTLLVVSLIGTTVVPYNLFLHAHILHKDGVQDLHYVRKDLFINILIGGIISGAIIVASASVKGLAINEVEDLSKGLEPVFGGMAYWVVGLGLFAAGLSSAITSPLAVSMVVNGFFPNRFQGIESRKSRLVSLGVLAIGFSFSLFNYKPVEMIKVAQFLNGLLLPGLAVLLLILVNKRVVMKTYKNKWYHNIVISIVIVVCAVLGMKGVFSALNAI